MGTRDEMRLEIGSWTRSAAPVVNDEVDHRGEVLRSAPRVNYTPLIGAHEPEKAAIGVDSGHRLRGEPGIGGGLGLKLNFADVGPGLLCESKFEHVDALVVSSEGRSILMGRLTAWNKENLIEVEVLFCGTGNGEMPEMYRVECPTEESDTSGVFHLRKRFCRTVQEAERRSISISPRTCSWQMTN